MRIAVVHNHPILQEVTGYNLNPTILWPILNAKFTVAQSTACVRLLSVMNKQSISTPISVKHGHHHHWQYMITS